MDVWVQPSEAATLTIDAELVSQDTGQTLGAVGRTVTVPRAAIYPVVFLPGITSTQPPQYGQDQADRLLSLANIIAGYNTFYEHLERLGYERDQSYFLFPYNWLASNIK
jgi:hypothetical protein